MKCKINLLFALLTFNCAQAQPIHIQTPHEWHLTLNVVDENGQPVADAKAGVGFYYTSPPPAMKYTAAGIDGLTDTNGTFRASHTGESCVLNFSVEKVGYYATRSNYNAGYGAAFDFAKWNPVLTLVLKKCGHPIPMYAKHEETKIQKENEPLGFDLMAGDWVAPFGTGKTTDMLFTVSRKIESESKYEAQLKLTFPNSGDGIAIAPAQPETGSEFRTWRIASENGYQFERTWHYSNTGGPEFVSGYFFRVRTVLDESGNVKSTLYGKIPGDFRFYAGTKAPHAGMGFDYFLNPTPNDRNVEFDTKQNLIKSLSIVERAKQP